MRPDDICTLIPGTSNYTWLKEYMAPLRERVERRKILDDARTELLELKRENQNLRQMVAQLSNDDRPAARFFRKRLPRLFHITL